MVPTILELDPNANPDELAEQIVMLPDGTDLGSDAVGKLGRTLLTTKEGRDPDPAKYAQIFDLVRRNSLVTPWMAYAAWAESANGRRRVKGANMVEIADELGELAREAAEVVPNGTPKYLLLGGIAYNRGIVCRGLRQYRDEESSQRFSAGWYAIAGQPAKSDTSLFAAQVGAVSAAFVSGDAIEESIKALVAARNFAENQMYPYPPWMKDNAPVHIGFAVMMGLLMKLPFNDLRDETDFDFKAGRTSGMRQWQRAFTAFEDYENSNWEAVVNANPVNLQSSSADNAALTVRLLVALAKEKQRDAEGARRILTEIQDHQGPDGGIPMSVARYLLETR